MSQTAAHLVDGVLPALRLRQWVVTFPQPLPRLLAWRPDLLGKVLSLVSRSVQAHLRVPSGRSDEKAGMVPVVRTFTGDLCGHVHVDALVPDVVAAEPEEREVDLVPARAPFRDELMAQRIGEGLGRRWAASLGEAFGVQVQAACRWRHRTRWGGSGWRGR